MERKLIWKFNIIDLILIGVVILSLVALVYKLTWGRDSNDEQAFLFTYVCASAPAEVYDGIATGTECSDGDYGNSLGKLTNLTLSDIPGDDRNKEARFMAAVSGKLGDHGVTVGDVLYLKGKECNLVVGDSVFSVYLSDMQPVE